MLKTNKKKRLLAGPLMGAAVALAAWPAPLHADWLANLPLVATAEAATPTATAADDGQTRSSTQAKVRLLDKQTGRKQILTLVAGQPQTVGTMTLTLSRCLWDYRGRPKLDLAWLDAQDSALSERGFQGWMFNAYPDVATLEHPRFDLQLVECVTPEGARRLLPRTVGTVPTPVTTTGGEGFDAEAPASESPGSMVVPGVSDGSAGQVQPPNPFGPAEETRIDAPGQRIQPQTPPATPVTGDDPFYVPGMDNSAPPPPQAEPLPPEPQQAMPQEPLDAAAPGGAPPGDGEDREELRRLMDGGW